MPPLALPPTLLAADAAPQVGTTDAAASSDVFPKHIVPWHQWVLFDPFLSPRDSHLYFGLVTEQPVGGGPGTQQGGFTLGFGQGIESRRGHLFAHIDRDWLFRLTGSGHAVLNLLQYGVFAGPALGPLEIGGGASLGLAQVHFAQGGFGLGFLSPRAEVSATLLLGPIRVAVQAYDEYAWRWTSGPSAFVRGVLLEIGLGSSPKLPDKYKLVP